MAMQFNPSTAFLRGMDLGSPTTSQGGINNLMQMQQNTINDALNAFGNIGKTSRTNTVNDLIARGGLEGLNEAQTQARLLQEAGGTLTPEGQAQVDALLQRTGKEDQRKFQTGERIAGQEFNTTERLGRQGFDTQERLSGEKFRSGESALERAQRERLELLGIKSQEKIASNRDATDRRGQYKEVQGADGMMYNVTPEGKMIPLVKGQLPYASGSGKGSGGSGRGDDDEIFKVTGALADLYKNSTSKGKLAIQTLYESGHLQGVDIIKTDKDGKPYTAGQKMFYKGEPVTVKQLRDQLGLK